MNETKTVAKKPSSFITILIVLMLVAGLVGGIFGYYFGQKSLDGINLAPLNRTPQKTNPK